MKIPLPNDIITPKKSTISCVKEKTSSNGRSIMVYSFTPDKKSDYLSHAYTLDKRNTGTEIIFDSEGIMIAEIPIYHGRVHGNGHFFDPVTLKEETWHFFHGEPLPPGTEYKISEANDAEEILTLSANASGLWEEDLLKKRPAQYIFNRKEKEMNFVFRPVAQNTIIRPLAEAVCMMHGGEEIPYTDPTDKKEKRITFEHLHMISGLEIITHGRKVPVSGDLIAFQARHDPEKTKLKVEINDVFVDIAPCTTVIGALGQFHRKLKLKNKMDARLFNRQKD